MVDHETGDQPACPSSTERACDGRLRERRVGQGCFVRLVCSALWTAQKRSAELCRFCTCDENSGQVAAVHDRSGGDQWQVRVLPDGTDQCQQSVPIVILVVAEATS